MFQLIFLFYFLKYDIYANLNFVKKHGFSVDDKPKEGTYTNWENLDENTPNKYEYVENVKLGIYYSDLIPILTKAIQEQQEIINTQQEQIDKHENELKIIRELLENK